MKNQPIGKVESVEYQDDGLDINALVRPDIADKLYESFTREPWWRALSLGYRPPRPLTRRERLMGRLYSIRWYLRHLGLALVNRCDREGDNG